MTTKLLLFFGLSFLTFATTEKVEISKFCWINQSQIYDFERFHNLAPLVFESGHPTYICRGWHNGNQVAGKFYYNVFGYPRCKSACDGLEIKMSDYQVLHTPRESVRWVSRNQADIESNALVVGTDHNFGGEATYICKGESSDGSYILGRAIKSTGKCLLPYHYNVYLYSYYDILELTESGKVQFDLGC